MENNSNYNSAFNELIDIAKKYLLEVSDAYQEALERKPKLIELEESILTTISVSGEEYIGDLKGRDVCSVTITNE